jgi:hypothetical protein
MIRIWQLTFHGTLAVAGFLALFQLVSGQAWDAILVRMAITILGVGLALFALGCWALHWGLWHPHSEQPEKTEETPGSAPAHSAGRR